MNSNNTKVIELSKVKVLLLIVGALAFVALGIWMLQLDSTWIESQRRFNSPALVHGVGVASIVFFGLCAVAAVMKLFDRKPGLVLSSTGILDNSSSASAGLIPWSEVQGFDVLKIQRQRLLIVKLVAPDKYVEVGSAVKRSLNRMNLKMCGSPIAITSNSLKINFDELLDVCNSYLSQYGKNV